MREPINRTIYHFDRKDRAEKFIERAKSSRFVAKSRDNNLNFTISPSKDGVLAYYQVHAVCTKHQYLWFNGYANALIDGGVI